MKNSDKDFWKKVTITKTCWIWSGGKNNKGYGSFCINGKSCFAHRYSYEQIKGKIPDGLTIDHLCRNPSCVNPAHLEPVSNRENTLRGNGASAVNARKVVCKRGHPFDRLKNGEYGLERDCTKCRLILQRRWRKNKQKGLHS